MLKGALLLRHWLGTETRPTRDIDLLGPTGLDERRMTEFLDDVLRLEVEDDGITFGPGEPTVRPIGSASLVLGLRARFEARLGRTRLRYQVDVGLGDSVFPSPVELVPGRLLGMPMATVRAYTPYTTIAEKLEAMVVLGLANSRIKDYYDLYQLPRALDVDGGVLVETVRRTFARRGTRIPPLPLDGLTEGFAREPLNAGRWRAFLAKGALTVDAPDLLGVVAGIRRFVEPVLMAAREERTFDRSWPRGGPWRETATTGDAG